MLLDFDHFINECLTRISVFFIKESGHVKCTWKKKTSNWLSVNQSRFSSDRKDRDATFSSWKARSHQLLNASRAQVWCLFLSVMYLIMRLFKVAFTTDSSPLLNSHTKKIFVMTTSSWRKPVRPVHVLTSSSAGTISQPQSNEPQCNPTELCVTGRRRLCSPSSLHTDVNECTVSWLTVSANIHRQVPRTNRRKQSMRAGRRAESSEEEIKSQGWGRQRKTHDVHNSFLLFFNSQYIKLSFGDTEHTPEQFHGPSWKNFHQRPYFPAVATADWSTCLIWHRFSPRCCFWCNYPSLEPALAVHQLVKYRGWVCIFSQSQTRNPA